MSLYGALNIGVAGLSANSKALSATSSNIANVNTVGYKNQTANFSSFLSGAGLGGGAAAGVTSVIGQRVTTQGLPTVTSSATDMSITGNGFFVVVSDPNSLGAQQYTRAGSFTPDEYGNLKNPNGMYLLGWKLDSVGAIPTNTGDLNLVNVNSLAGKAQATTVMSLQANLQSSSAAVGAYTAGDMNAGTVTPEFVRTINIYDSQGGSQPVTFSFVKTGANAWAYETTYAGNAANLSAPGSMHNGTITFNTDGSLKNVDGAVTPSGTFNLTIPWDATTGLAAQTIAINLGTVDSTNGLTQFDSSSALNSASLDGSLFGSVTGVQVGKDGTVTAQFSNGLSQDVFKIPVATFTNADGLAQVNGNAYVSTKASGAANVNEANTGNAGAVASQSLEGSTVDLATEFTNLITTQRAYSASARIITTANEMLQELERLR